MTLQELLPKCVPVSNVKISGIYLIYCPRANRGYIGSSKNIRTRVRSHFRDLKENEHVNYFLQNTFNKHGKQDFIEYVIEECRTEELLERERFYVDSIGMKNLYNLMAIDRKEMSQEIRDKLSKAGKGKKISEEQKQKLREARKSYVMSEETKRKISKTIREKNLSKYKSLKPSATKTRHPKKLDIEKIKEITQYRDWETDRKSTRLNSSHEMPSRMPSSA